MDILPLFCDLDDFCLLFQPLWQPRLLTSGVCRCHQPGALAFSEVMTIFVLFHLSGYRNFKAFYTQHVLRHYAGAFPRLVSYSRFVELQRDALMPLWCYPRTRFGRCTGISFVDSDDLGRLRVALALPDADSYSMPGQIGYCPSVIAMDERRRTVAAWAL